MKRALFSKFRAREPLQLPPTWKRAAPRDDLSARCRPAFHVMNAVAAFPSTSTLVHMLPQSYSAEDYHAKRSPFKSSMRQFRGKTQRVLG